MCASVRHMDTMPATIRSKQGEFIVTDAHQLPDSAHRPLKAGEVYTPYVPASQSPNEFTIKALLFGIIFGVLFGSANAYLGLRAGLTISTSIPVAVMTVVAGMTRPCTETRTGSAGAISAWVTMGAGSGPPPMGSHGPITQR